MYKVSSVHSNRHEDRSWSWECRDVVSRGYATGYSKTGYVNDFDSPMNFMCPANKYIVGMESYHDTNVRIAGGNSPAMQYKIMSLPAADKLAL